MVFPQTFTYVTFHIYIVHNYYCSVYLHCHPEENPHHNNKISIFFRFIENVKGTLKLSTYRDKRNSGTKHHLFIISLQTQIWKNILKCYLLHLNPMSTKTIFKTRPKTPFFKCEPFNYAQTKAIHLQIVFN